MKADRVREKQQRDGAKRAARLDLGGSIRAVAVTTAARALPAAPKRRLTRSEVAEYAGISKTGVRRLEGTLLHPEIGPRGVRLFGEEEVRTRLTTRRRVMRAERDLGDLAAEVFAALDAGTHPADIVKELRVEPRRVVELQHAWAEMRGALVVSHSGRVRLSALLRCEEKETANEQTFLPTVENACGAAKHLENLLRRELATAHQQIQSFNANMVRMVTDGFTR